jgi:hypothetical protein
LTAAPVRPRHRRSIHTLPVKQGSLASLPRTAACLQHPAAAEAQEVWTSSISTSAVLIVDATNRASVSAADARAYKHAGATLQSTFEAWLAFLRSLLQPQLSIAVFDPPQVAGTAVLNRPRPLHAAFTAMRLHMLEGELTPKQGTYGSSRQEAVPEYRKQRHAKAQQRRAAAQATRPRRDQQHQQSRVHYLHSVARAVGYTVIEATNGWEADDVIGALCAAADVAGESGE